MVNKFSMQNNNDIYTLNQSRFLLNAVPSDVEALPMICTCSVGGGFWFWLKPTKSVNLAPTGTKPALSSTVNWVASKPISFTINMERKQTKLAQYTSKIFMQHILCYIQCHDLPLSVQTRCYHMIFIPLL